MSAVRVDWYRVRCPRCGYDREFMIGADLGDLHAIDVGERMHFEQQHLVECDDDTRVTVERVLRAIHV